MFRPVLQKIMYSLRNVTKDEIDGADDALCATCFLVSSSTVFEKEYYLNTSHVENLGTSISEFFLNILHYKSEISTD